MAFGLHHLFRRRQAAWWTLVAGLALTAVLGWELHREAVALDKQRMALRVAEIQSQLDARMEKSEMLLHNLRDYLTWSGDTSEKGFQRWCYANGHTINCRWLAGIALATNRHVAKWPENVSKKPMTWGSSEIELLTAAAKAHSIECNLAMTSGVTNTMRFVEDYALRGTHGDRTPFGRTIESSRLGMSDQQVVMRDTLGNGVAGACFYVPIFRPEVNGLIAELMQGTRTNWSDRAHPYWLQFTSMIVAPVDFQFLTWTLSEGAPADVAIELFSSTNQTAQTWLNGSTGVPRAADPSFDAYMTHIERWPMYGRRFSIYFYTTPLFEAQSPKRLAKVTMAAGLGVSLLATALVAVASRARIRQEELAEQIREARDALAAAQRARNKISRDLHDGTIQSLYAIQLGLGHTVEKLEADPAKAGRGLSAVRKELDAVIAEIRQFITVETDADKPVDFGAVLHSLVERARNGTTAQLSLHCDPGASERLASEQAVQLANITREALSNSLRHGKPLRVEIALRSDGDTVVLEISDDGTGFDPKAPGRSGVGLISMTARTKEMGGALDIQSAPGKGARVVVRVPVTPPEFMEAD